jgi:transcriptional regulator with XRE-family HTH domain
MAPVNKAELGQYIKQSREDKHLSLRALAREAGIDAGALSRIENGERVPYYSPDKLAKIAEVLKLDEQKLYNLAGYSVPQGLPDLAPYLKAKYKLSDEAVDDMEDYLTVINAKYEERDEKDQE